MIVLLKEPRHRAIDDDIVRSARWRLITQKVGHETQMVGGCSGGFLDNEVERDRATQKFRGYVSIGGAMRISKWGSRTGLVLLSMALAQRGLASGFEQVNCKPSIDGQYVSVEFANGARRKSVNFVSDGITYWSDRIGETSASDYKDVTGVFFSAKPSARFGSLQIQYRDQKHGIEVVGTVDVACWREIRALLKILQVASHIEIRMIHPAE